MDIRKDANIWSGTARICRTVAMSAILELLLCSCGGSPSFPPMRRLTGLDVQPHTAEAVAPSGTAPFSANGTYDQAPTTVTSLPAQWTSSNSAVATVDSNSGLATCVAVGGQITITASVAGQTASAMLSCLAAPSSGSGHCAYVCPSVRCPELTGYCGSSDGGACRQAYDPFHCKVGQPAQTPVTDSCGVGVDTATSCTP